MYRLPVLSGGKDSHAGGVEDEGFYFGFATFGGDFLAIPEEGDSGSVADFGDDFAGGSNRSVGGCDERFLADGLAVGEDGDPRSLGGADYKRQGGR